MLHQPPKGYRAGLDAVLLAATVPEIIVKGKAPRLLDVGAGVGTVGLCAAIRHSALEVVLVENTATLCELSQRNIAENGLTDRVSVVRMDVTARETGSTPGLADNSFDMVVSNPPYYENARHRRSPHALKAVSHGMTEDGLDTWLRYMARKCRAGGMGMMIHRADQLGPLLQLFSKRFGDICVLPLHARSGEAAGRVIISGVKGSRAPLKLLPGLVLHGDGNRFLPEIDRVLKSPAPLPIGLSSPKTDPY